MPFVISRLSNGNRATILMSPTFIRRSWKCSIEHEDHLSPCPATQMVLMGNASSHVTALIKELLALNRAEAVTTAPSTPADVERWKPQRKKLRQELVQALAVRGL
jgi:hypothetical protein